MAHLLIASVALAALLATLAVVLVLQRERPGLRRLGGILLLALAAVGLGLLLQA